MPLPKMPTRQDTRPGENNPHARDFDPETGGWTKPVETPPAPERT